MVQRNYQKPHRFICVTDEYEGIDKDIEVIPIWNDHAKLQSTMGRTQPSCYRRLRMFSPEAEKWFGKRFVSVDLDAVIVDDMSPVWDRDEDFMIWGDTSPGTPYNGSMIMMNAGARKQVWEQFDPKTSPKQAKSLRYIGSDQAWIGACLGKNEKIWTRADGVMSFRNEVSRDRNAVKKARIIFFHGLLKPWDRAVTTQHPWVREHWR